MWCSMFSICAFIAYVTRFVSGSTDMAAFYLIPLWCTLFFYGPWFLPVRYPCFLVATPLLLFLFITCWIRTYPMECRQEWLQKMNFDPNWNFDMFAETLMAHSQSLVPGVRGQELTEWIEDQRKRQVSNRRKRGRHGRRLNATNETSVKSDSAEPPGNGGEIAQMLSTGGLAALSRTTTPAPPEKRGQFFDISNTPTMKKAKREAWKTAARSTSPPPLANTTKHSSADGWEMSSSFLDPESPDIVVSNFMLRAYCVHYDNLTYSEHGHAFPKIFVFSNMVIVPPVFEWVPQRFHCYPWTCYFTEKNPRQRWMFHLLLWSLVAANVAYWRGFGSNLDSCLGSGEFRQWCLWFWVTFLPIWSIMFVTRIKEGNFEEYVRFLLSEAGTIISNAQSVCSIVILLILVAFLYATRERLYHILSIEDHNVVHWINWNNLHRNMHHQTIQVCIWRVEISDNVMNEVAKWTDSRTEGDGMRGRGSAAYSQLEEEPSSPAPKSPGSRDSSGSKRGYSRDLQVVPRSSSFFGLPIYAADIVPEKYTLNFPGGHPPNFFMRVAYGDNELQNTRVQRMNHSLNDYDKIYLQENFRVASSGSGDTFLYIEANDQSLISRHTCGRMAKRERDIILDCRRDFDSWCKAEANAQPRGRNKELTHKQFALDQIIEMLERGPTDDPVQEERNMKEMYFRYGFKPRELSEGGIVWVAFAMPEEEQTSACSMM